MCEGTQLVVCGDVALQIAANKGYQNSSHCTPSHRHALTVSKETFTSNIKSKQRQNPENLHYLLLLPKRIGELHFGIVVGKGNEVLGGLRTEFLFGVLCRAACNTKCVCVFVCVCVCVCVCMCVCV